jgi:LacI family transcriptional regulator
MAVTIKDVAKLAGVSTATVSRVINNDSRISEETRERVLECLKKLDYKVNSIARSLKTNRSYTVGFICPELPNTFFMTVAKGVEDELKKHGYSLIICNSNESIEEEKKRIDLLCEKCVDGVIIIPATNEGDHYNLLKNSNIPVVLTDRLVENFVSDAVLVDNINGTYAAIEYLISQGHRRIGYIGGDVRYTPAKERDDGYRRALQDYCIPIEEQIMKYGDFHVQSGYEKMKELMEGQDPPTHIFITNYFMHVGATKYLIEHKNSIEIDISIASFDDMELASILGYGGILISQPMMEIGSRAAQILLDRINNEDLYFPQIVRLKAELTKR